MKDLQIREFLVRNSIPFTDELPGKLEIYALVGAAWANSLYPKSLYLGVQPRQEREYFPVDTFIKDFPFFFYVRIVFLVLTKKIRKTFDILIFKIIEYLCTFFFYFFTEPGFFHYFFYATS